MWKKTVFRNYFLAAAVLNVIAAIGIVLFKGFLPPLVPLFYGRPTGEAQLTSSLGLLIAPITSLVITIVNFLLVIWVKDDFLKKILAISAVLVSILTAITIIKIVLLVGFF